MNEDLKMCRELGESHMEDESGGHNEIEINEAEYHPSSPRYESIPSNADLLEENAIGSGWGSLLNNIMNSGTNTEIA